MLLPELCMGCMQPRGGAEVCPICGWKTDAQDLSQHHLPVRTVLKDRYLLGRVLGQGGFGITYLAYDLALHIRLAIKEYMPVSLAARAVGGPALLPISNRDAEAQYQYGLDKFLEEARILAQFSDDPGIVSVRDCFEANGTAYIVMNYIQGGTFKELLQWPPKRLGFTEAMLILRPVMEALVRVHRTGLLHRDVSPDNIYISSEGQVRLLDFGAARYAVGEQSHSLSVILKAGYAPVEQYYSRGVQGPWTDVYAVAATLYRAVTGTVPPEALERIQAESLAAPSALGAALPDPAETALMKGLAIQARERYQSMEEFLGELVSDAEPEAEDQRRILDFVPLELLNRPVRGESGGTGFNPAGDQGGGYGQGSFAGGGSGSEIMAGAGAATAPVPTGLGETQGPPDMPSPSQGPPIHPGHPGLWHGWPALKWLLIMVLLAIFGAGGFLMYQHMGTKASLPTVLNVYQRVSLAPQLSGLLTAGGIDQDTLNPVNPTNVFTMDSPQIYVLASFSNMAPANVTVNWYYTGNGARELVKSQPVTAAGQGLTLWAILSQQNYRVGSWEVEIVSGSQLRQSLAFKITAGQAQDTGTKPSTPDTSNSTPANNSNLANDNSSSANQSDNAQTNPSNTPHYSIDPSNLHYYKPPVNYDQSNNQNHYNSTNTHRRR